MRCPQCGYVSFDQLAACKKCGADLREVKRRRGIPTFTAAPVGSPRPPTPLSARPSEPEPPQKQEDRAQDVDAFFAGLLQSSRPPHTSEQEPQEEAAFSLPLGTLPPFEPSPDAVALPVTEWADDSRPVRAAALPKAGFWIRMAAWITDIVCLFLATIVLALLTLTTIWLGGRLGGEINDQVMALAGYSGAVIVIATGFLYFTLFVGACGQTPGKRLFGLKVVPVNDREMTYGRAGLRSLCWILSLLLFSVGFLMIAFTWQKRGLHDMLAGTYVIRT
ncbi:MAG: RDD family protein [candidate division NC10 bacterium]|nr:RDD family protein [candidate division NC10 bacterium]